MPTSSKRGTCQERRLYEGFKTVYYHLWYACMDNEASEVADIFSDLLETTRTEILHEMRTNHDIRYKLGEGCKNKSDSDNVCIAADCMADVGGCLLGFGRKEDGARFCEWSLVIRDLAQSLYEEEQAVKQRGRRDSVYTR